MTYPPQPGQPYGQQPRQQGPYQPGGFHHGGNQPPYGPPPGYPSPGSFGSPPRKSRRGLWIGLASALVVLIALAITGFVAPGFFLSKDSNKGAPNGGTDGQAIASQFVDALNVDNGETRGKLRCHDAPGSEDKYVARAALEGHDGVKFQLGQPQPDPANAQNKIFSVTGTSGSSYDMVIAAESGKACVLHFVDPSQ